MYQTFDVTVSDRRIFRSVQVTELNKDAAHKDALDVALKYASKNPREVPIVKLVNHA